MNYNYNYPLIKKFSPETLAEFKKLAYKSRETGLEYGKTLCHSKLSDTVTSSTGICIGTECEVDIYNYRKKDIFSQCIVNEFSQNEGIFHIHPKLKKIHELGLNIEKTIKYHPLVKTPYASYSDLWNALYHKVYNIDNGTTCIMNDTNPDLMVCYYPDKNKENEFEKLLQLTSEKYNEYKNLWAPAWLWENFITEEIPINSVTIESKINENFNILLDKSNKIIRQINEIDDMTKIGQSIIISIIEIEDENLKELILTTILYNSLATNLYYYHIDNYRFSVYELIDNSFISSPGSEGRFYDINESETINLISNWILYTLIPNINSKGIIYDNKINI